MKFRFAAVISFALSVLILAPAHATATTNTRVLLVISSNGADEGRLRPGFEMDELTQAWAIFTDNGLQVEIASPAGGPVVADRFHPNKPYNSRFLNDPAAAAMLAATRPLTSVRTETYGAIFVIGGKGAMFDLPINVDLKALLAATYQAGGVIGAVCHGPAVFMNVPMGSDGSLVRGRALTAFSNEEEALFGNGWAPSFPVLLEDGLRGSGAIFSEAPLMLPHVVTDGRLVTGQNPHSTAAAVEAVVRAMGRVPVDRTPWADERSMNMILQTLGGERDAALAAFHANPQLYDVQLIAAWGLFRSRSPGVDRAALTHALEMMELAQPFFSRPQIEAGIAEARSRLVTMP